MWEWTGAETIILSRATDETGYVQPTRAELMRVRGAGTQYHFNPIYGWRVMPNGRVFFHGARPHVILRSERPRCHPEARSAEGSLSIQGSYCRRRAILGRRSLRSAPQDDARGSG